MDIMEDLKELAKFGIGDAVVQYPYYKFLGDKVVSHLGAFGKYADVAGATLYALAVKLLADSVGGEFEEYLNQGASSVLGRSISVAMGDPAINVPVSNTGSSGSGVANYSTLRPVPLKTGGR